MVAGQIEETKQMKLKMKRLITLILLTVVPILTNAQALYEFPGDIKISSKVIEIFSTILALFIVLMFIFAVLKLVLGNRLKSKMVDKGVSEKLAEQFLRPVNDDSKSQSIKWFLVLAGIGLGLTIVNFTLPLGIHSIAIMAFSLALSYLGYFYFLRRLEE